MRRNSGRPPKERPRKRAVEGRLALHELVAPRGMHVDAARWGAYGSLFTEDGVMVAGWGDPVQGRGALRAWLVENEGNTSGKRHVGSNVVVEATATGARAVHYLTVLEREELPGVVATALITQDFVKTAEGWRVERHEVAVDPGMFKALQSA